MVVKFKFVLSLVVRVWLGVSGTKSVFADQESAYCGIHLNLKIRKLTYMKCNVFWYSAPFCNKFLFSGPKMHTKQSLLRSSNFSSWDRPYLYLSLYISPPVCISILFVCVSYFLSLYISPPVCTYLYLICLCFLLSFPLYLSSCRYLYLICLCFFLSISPTHFYLYLCLRISPLYLICLCFFLSL